LPGWFGRIEEMEMGGFGRIGKGRGSVATGEYQGYPAVVISLVNPR